MKAINYSTKLALFSIAFAFFQAFSLDPTSPDDPLGNCELNFTSYPYQPSGDCHSDQDTIRIWDTFQTTRCCRNVLTALTQALALHAKTTNGTIFVEQNLWNNCTGSFLQQNSVSISSCGFGDLSYSTDRCSSLLLPSIVSDKSYQVALDKCSAFGPTSFDDACLNCTTAILDFREFLLEENGVKEDDDDERAVCGIGAIISVVAGKLDNRTVVENFFRCLPALDNLETNYFKIKYSVAKLLFTVIIAVAALMLIILLIKYVTKKKTRKPVQSKEISTWSGDGLYRFSKAEIENAINFGKERKSLGRGSAGQVFKGILPSGQVVAIKKIYKSNTSDSFISEVRNLSRVRHPNLVCLLGCCVEDGDQYLVYEYCAEGNLSQHLLRKNTRLTWDLRVKILRDCALALRYLHQFIDGCIVHRDIKLTNILLTEELKPKLSDFGLAKMLGMDETKVFTDVRGTIGYMDPEYMTNAKLTCASDIYSFGIVALQLLSGQKVIELDLDARDQLTRKAKDVNMGLRPLTDFEDPRLKGDVNRADFESILQIAVLCVAKSSKGRPTVDVVFEEMDKTWKNTLANMKAKQVMPSPAASFSKSLDVMPL